MSFEIVVRPASAVPVLKPVTPVPSVTSEDDEAWIEWGTGSLSLASRAEIHDGSYDGNYGGGGGGGYPHTCGRKKPAQRFWFITANSLNHYRELPYTNGHWV